MGKYLLDRDLFEKDFIKGGNFYHKTNNVFKLFPYTGSTSDKGLDNFDSILGAFIRAVFDLQEIKNIEFEEVVVATLKKIEINPEEDKHALHNIIKSFYFTDNGFLKCDSLQTYIYSKNTNNENKVSAYIASVLCDKEVISNSINQSRDRNSNLLDKIIVESLPRLNKNEKTVNYYNMIDDIKILFTEDLCFLIEKGSFNSNEIIELVSYYYFYYVSQAILKLDKTIKDEKYLKEELFFCLSWEKTSKSRKCYKFGWRKIERCLDDMFSHAVLLDMINHIQLEKICCYDDLYQFYSDCNEENRIKLYNQVNELKNKYVNEYITDINFSESEIEFGDLAGLIKAFHTEIRYQFLHTVRKRANDAYQKSFMDFSRNNFLQNRKRNGLMLALDEENIILLTKVILKNQERMKLNELFSGFEKRGVFFDKQSKEMLIMFYDTLGLIEKKSDSGDAKYVKGIL